MGQSYPKTAARLPLSALLSATLVAFTIELDNEFERRMPHRTSTGGARGKRGPLLTSVAMYLNCLQFVPDEGIDASELVARARTRTNFHGMVRWGYVTIEDHRVRLSANGRSARETWSLLLPELEERWTQRFGRTQIDALRTHLASIVRATETPMPDCLPILGHGLSCIERVQRRKQQTHATASLHDERRLIPLLSKALLVLAVLFERESALSIAVCANVIRVLDESGTRVRDLPFRSGVSKEAIAMATGFLEKRGYVTLESNGRQGKSATLTQRGIEAQREYGERIVNVEERFGRRFGTDADAVARTLEPIVGNASRTASPLFACLNGYPDGWRASMPARNILPHFPMVLHRGGFPDGS